MLISISIVTIFRIITEINSKKEFYNLRNGKKKLLAKVVEYKKYKSPLRNDYTQILYPHVIIIGDEDEKSIRLKFTRYPKKPFKIGEEINVFWHGKLLYFWDAYDIGWQKKIPSNWDFLKSK